MHEDQRRALAAAAAQCSSTPVVQHGALQGLFERQRAGASEAAHSSFMPVASAR
jgi:hypothetical protein